MLTNNTKNKQQQQIINFEFVDADTIKYEIYGQISSPTILNDMQFIKMKIVSNFILATADLKTYVTIFGNKYCLPSKDMDFDLSNQLINKIAQINLSNVSQLVQIPQTIMDDIDDYPNTVF